MNIVDEKKQKIKIMKKTKIINNNIIITWFLKNRKNRLYKKSKANQILGYVIYSGSAHQKAYLN